MARRDAFWANRSRGGDCHLPPLWGGDRHVSEERLSIAENVELERLEVVEIGAVQYVINVLLRDGFPDVHAD